MVDFYFAQFQQSWRHLHRTICTPPRWNNLIHCFNYRCTPGRLLHYLSQHESHRHLQQYTGTCFDWPNKLHTERDWQPVHIESDRSRNECSGQYSLHGKLISVVCRLGWNKQWILRIHNFSDRDGRTDTSRGSIGVCYIQWSWLASKYFHTHESTNTRGHNRCSSSWNNYSWKNLAWYVEHSQCKIHRCHSHSHFSKDLSQSSSCDDKLQNQHWLLPS